MTIPKFLLDNFPLAPQPRTEEEIQAQRAHRPITPKRGEDIFEGTDYPREWDGFVGQEQAKKRLMVAVMAAKARGERLDHTLLACGQHGVGKTTLATMLAYQAGAGIVQATGPLDVEKARRLMVNMKDGDILFIDEAHLLVQGGKTKADWLLPFMTEGHLLTDEGAIDCPDITIVAATTDAGKLPRTLLTRFMVKPKLVAYTDQEAAFIADNLATRMQVQVTPEQCVAIAKAADGNPRDMRSILTAVRDLKLAFPTEKVDMAMAFDWAGFSEDGLSQVAREILMVLRSQRAFTASTESLQAMLGEPGPLRHHEQALMQRGYLTVTGRGRQLTDAGLQRANQLGREDF